MLKLAGHLKRRLRNTVAPPILVRVLPRFFLWVRLSRSAFDHRLSGPKVVETFSFYLDRSGSGVVLPLTFIFTPSIDKVLIVLPATPESERSVVLLIDALKAIVAVTLDVEDAQRDV